MKKNTEVNKTIASEETIQQWHKGLRSWHKKNNRHFPWRENSSIYELTVAEVLLQKTPASRIINTYNWIINGYTSFNELACADVKILKKKLQILGLQKRAVFLKNISSKIVKEYKGVPPSNEKKLLSLPGIGSYTSRAIMCFGFNKRCAVVDSNVGRIYKRVFDFRSEKEKPSTDLDLRRFAEKMLPKHDFRQYNYALLDFAALICKSKNPKCDKCFAAEFCKNISS